MGCGFQGRLHVACLQGIPDVEVVAVCDRDRLRAADLAREHDVEFVHEDHRELLAAHELDVVTVATMPASHREIVIDALEAGAHVLCEKPFANHAGAALAMVRAARACERTLSVGYNMRFMKAARAVRAFIAEGWVGLWRVLIPVAAIAQRFHEREMGPILGLGRVEQICPNAPASRILALCHRSYT